MKNVLQEFTNLLQSIENREPKIVAKTVLYALEQEVFKKYKIYTKTVQGKEITVSNTAFPKIKIKYLDGSKRNRFYFINSGTVEILNERETVA